MRSPVLKELSLPPQPKIPSMGSGTTDTFHPQPRISSARALLRFCVCCFSSFGGYVGVVCNLGRPALVDGLGILAFTALFYRTALCITGFARITGFATNERLLETKRGITPNHWTTPSHWTAGFASCVMHVFSIIILFLLTCAGDCG